MKNICVKMIYRVLWLVLLLNIGFSYGQQARTFPYYLPLTGTSKPSEIEEHSGSNAPAKSKRYTKNGYALTYDKAEHAFTGFALSKLPFTSVNGIEVEFKYAMIDGKVYNGRNGDGMSMFLYDSDKAFKIGGQGASLGYVYRKTSKSSTTKPGLNGGYLGVGLDLYGDFKNQSQATEEGKEGIAGGGFKESGMSHITLRGGQYQEDRVKGYPVLYTTSTKAGSGKSNATLDYSKGDYKITNTIIDNPFDLRTGYDKNGQIIYVTVVVSIIPKSDGSGSSISLKTIHAGGESIILNSFFYAHKFKTRDQQGKVYDYETKMPNNFKIGFAAGTGGATQTHLVKDVVIRLPYSHVTEDQETEFCLGYQSSKGIKAILSPFDYAQFYKGPIDSPIAGNSIDFIDYDSFRFENSEGYPVNVDSPFEYVKPGVGRWIFNRESKLVTFEAEADSFKEGDEEVIYFSAKGYNRINEAPFGDEMYRSRPTKLMVKMTECRRMVNPLIPVKIEIRDN